MLFLTTAMFVLPAERVTLPGLGVQTTAKSLLSLVSRTWLVLSHSTFWAHSFSWVLVAEEPEMFTTAVLAAGVGEGGGGGAGDAGQGGGDGEGQGFALHVEYPLIKSMRSRGAAPRGVLQFLLHKIATDQAALRRRTM